MKIEDFLYFQSEFGFECRIHVKSCHLVHSTHGFNDKMEGKIGIKLIKTRCIQALNYLYVEFYSNLAVRGGIISPI